MLQPIRVLITTIIISGFLFADIFITEIADPDNSSDAGRYVELYNNGDFVVELDDWQLQRYTNGNVDPQSPIDLSGSIVPGGFYIVCNNADKFAITYGESCDLDIGVGGAADSNGDDQLALLEAGVIKDFYGNIGQDGSGQWHEFEDGRAERAVGVTTGCTDTTGAVCESEWVVDNDSGGGDGTQFAPGGFDPMSWIGAGEVSNDVYGCMDIFGLNFNADATIDDGGCAYATHVVEVGNMYFSPEDISINIGESVQWNNVQGYHDVVADDGSFSLDGCSGPCLIGSHTFDVAGSFSYVCSPHAAMGMVGTITVVDPTVSVTFSVDMSIEGVTDDGVSVRVNGGEWFAMDDSDGDLTYTYTMNLVPGDYEYNFYDGWYEDGGFGDCAGGNYGNDRFLTVENDVVLDTVCWESCETCAVVVEGCTDSTALNFDENATVDNGTCEYAEVEEAAPLFFSEAAEGSSNNKYLEIYNPTNQTVDLTNYAFANTSNAPSVPGEYEYFTTLTNSLIEPGDVFVICHGSSDDSILEECDQFHTYMSNGDDGFCLIHGSPNEDNTSLNAYTILDCVGDWYADPGDGWDVAGVPEATKDHTIVRKSTVTSGNTDWAASAGTNADDSEWVVFDVDTWDYVGFHPHDFSTDVPGCTNETACNYNSEATVDDGSCYGPDSCGECDGNGSDCTLIVWATVDMSFAEVGDAGMKARISTINGEYSPSEWFPMEDNMGDGTWSVGLEVTAGNTYGYNFNNSIGFGYESGSGLGDCASGNYGNDRFISIPLDAVPGSVIEVPVVCWESCEACPTDILGCMDETAENYNSNATIDDDSCIYGWPEIANLFFSEYAEGSSNNKYLEIYNATDQDVDLSGYSLSSCSNGCNDGVSWDYADNVTFEVGTIVLPGDVYVVCHGSADDDIQAECDQTFTYLSNGDDVFALTQIGSGDILDMIGTIGDDPGNGWEVAGIPDATKDHTLVRKTEVAVGNAGYWEASAGDEDESEWAVFDQNTWVYLGFHPHNFDAVVPGCTVLGACNYNVDATEDDGSCAYPEDNFDCDGNCLVETDCTGVCGGSAEVDSCGICDGDSSSCNEPECNYNGDSNGDGLVNVTDVVLTVGLIINGNAFTPEQLCTSDLNQDGLINVTDIVFLVGIIINGTASNYNDDLIDIASEAIIKVDGNSLNIVGIDGDISGVELTLNHDNDFKIELEDVDISNLEFASTKKINSNTTKLILIKNGLERIALTKGDYEITDAIVVSGNGNSAKEIHSNIMYIPKEFKLKSAYPNPFNPITTLEMEIPQTGFVSVKVFNLVGQEVASLVNTVVEATSSLQLQFDAANLASGIYIVRAEALGSVQTQKLMLLK